MKASRPGSQMGVSRTLHFNQPWAIDSSAQIHDRLKNVFNAKNSTSIWSTLCRLYLPQPKLNPQTNQHAPPPPPQSKSKHLYILNSDTSPVAYTLVVDAGRMSFLETGVELETIVGKLKATWASRQAMRVDGLVYRPPNLEMRIKFGTIMVGSMAKGVVLELTALGEQDEQTAVRAIRTVLEKLFSDVPGFAGLDVNAVVADTVDSNVAWLKEEMDGEAHSAFALMSLCHALLVK
ncbi:hypothetical protein HDU98_009486 [Podochytrium sp. JEL0797]|nr:hypothetical protein HDU98_009486 [Podochytrium sp. JEL0797]